MNKNYYFNALLILGVLFLGLKTETNAQITTYPYLETFGSSSCALPTGYSNSGSDPWDFQNTSETYMEGLDHTSNGGCFASMDDSGGAADDSCLLTTPSFDLTSLPTPQLRFWWQNSNSTSSSPAATGPRPWSNLYLDVSINGGTTWVRNVWMVEDSQQIGWAEAVVNLTTYKSSNTVLRFRGLETQYFQSDMSLDDILIYQPQAWDAELVGISSPGTLDCGDSSATVSITVKNNGANAIPALPVYYQVGTGTPVHDTITSIIASSASASFTFSTPISGIMPGGYNLKVWTDLLFDSTYTNDTAYSTFDRPPTVSSFPYYEDFESGTGGWAAVGASSSWAFGTPNKSTIQGAASDSNAWVTGGLGTGTYNSNEDSYVGGPCFDFSGTQGNLWVAMDIWWNAENSWDGSNLQYSTDSGATWTNVGSFGDPNNWYTDNSINGNPGGSQEGWTGRASSSNGSGGWVFAKHTLPASLANFSDVLFRVTFGSDGSVQDDGFAFDNFTLVDYTTVQIDSSQTFFCGDSSAVNVVLTTSGVSSWGTYDWNVGGSADTILATSPGLYEVTFTDTLLNQSSKSSTTITTSPFPVVGFVGETDTILLADSLVLAPILDTLITNISWSPTGDTTGQITVDGVDYGAGSHIFSVTGTTAEGCASSDSFTVVVIDITGIGELNDATIQLFPNPVSDYLNVRLQGIGDESVQLELYSLQGQLIYSETPNTKLKNNVTINMSNLDAGTYMLVLSSGGDRMTQPIIKK